MSCDLALLVSGGSGMVLAARFAQAALESGRVDTLHLVVTGPATKVLAHELGPEWASARGLRDSLTLRDDLRERIRPHLDSELTASISSGSHLLRGVVVLPCSAGMAGALARLRDEGVKPKFIYVVPDFQNPTGITMSLAKRERLLDLAYEFDVPVVEDSPYRDLRYRGETLPAIFSLDQERGGGQVIGLYTFSKIFCPGMRVGFNIGPKDVIAGMTCIKEGNILNTPKYNQDLCTAFLEDMDLEAHILRCRDYYREKLNLFLAAMEEHFPEGSGVSWTVPEGGLFLWVSLPEEIDTAELFFDAIQCKVAFVPGEQFYGENPAKNHLRINFSYVPKDQLVEAVRRLAGCILKR